MIPLRQKLLREKWLWALCLAILVHVGFFFVFYLNVHKEPAQVANEGVDIATPSVATDVGQDLSPSIAKTYTVTDTDTDSTDTMEAVSHDDAVVTQPTPNQEPPAISNTDEALSAQTLTEDSMSTSPKPVSTLKERAQKSGNLNTQSDKISLSMPANSIDALESMKTQAGLLSIDIPTEQPHVKIDKAYLSVKSEVEEINNQLSAAINEVKQRNQQKIDEVQQLRNGNSTKQDKDVTESSEQAIQND